MFCGFLRDLVNSCVKIVTETYFKTWIWQCPVQMLMIYFGPSTLDRKFLLLTVVGLDAIMSRYCSLSRFWGVWDGEVIAGICWQ